MSEGTFTVRWDERSDSKFYAIDNGTYPVKVEDINWRKSRNDNDMAIVKFHFSDGARVTKPRLGTVIDRNRSLDNLFMFDLPFQLEAVFDFLVAAGAATPEELEAKGHTNNEEMFKLFEETRGAELAVRVQKRKVDTDENPNARVDDLDQENRIRGFFHKDSPQYERAVNALSATVDTSSITMGSGGRKKRS